VKGTPYEMGYALGQLYADEINANLQNLLRYGQSEIYKVANALNISTFAAEIVWEELEPVAFNLLDLNYDVALPYIPQRFIDELQGIHDGSGGKVDLELLRRVNMLPELI